MIFYYFLSFFRLSSDKIVKYITSFYNINVSGKYSIYPRMTVYLQLSSINNHFQFCSLLLVLYSSYSCFF